MVLQLPYFRNNENRHKWLLIILNTPCAFIDPVSLGLLLLSIKTISNAVRRLGVNGQLRDNKKIFVLYTGVCTAWIIIDWLFFFSFYMLLTDYSEKMLNLVLICAAIKYTIYVL